MAYPAFLKPSFVLASFLAIGLLNTSFLCSEGNAIPSLPDVAVDSLRLILYNPELGSRGAYLTWDYPVNKPVTYFELYRGFNPDSLGLPVLTNIAPAPRFTRVEIPDSSPPYTLYFGMRAVEVDPTGQKKYSMKIRLDSLRLMGTGAIHRPLNGDTVLGREIPIEVRTGSDPGQTLRQIWFEKRSSGWVQIVDTCLPRSECEKPVFGTITLLDTIVLSGSPTPISTLFCVMATEANISQSHGLKQSLGCSRFERME